MLTSTAERILSEMDCIGTGATSQTPSSHQRADFAHSWEHAPSPTQHIAKDLLNPEELCNSAVTHSAATGKLATRLKTPGGYGRAGGCGASATEGLHVDVCDVGRGTDRKSVV